jgi:hypothetical protein
MAQIPVSIGIPSLVMRKRSHVVIMVDDGRLELVRRIPYIVVFVGLVVANFAYVGAGPFVGLRNGLGYGMIALGVAFVLAFSLLVIGKRVWIDKEQMAQAGVVFLPEWTYAMLLAVLIDVVLTLT